MGNGDLSAWVREPGCEAGNSTTSSAKVKISGAVLQLLYPFFCIILQHSVKNSALVMKAERFSKTWVLMCQNTWCHIPDDHDPNIYQNNVTLHIQVQRKLPHNLWS
jgi:hypothetical protein